MVLEKACKEPQRVHIGQSRNWHSFSHLPIKRMCSQYCKDERLWQEQVQSPNHGTEQQTAWMTHILRTLAAQVIQTLKRS